MFGMQGIDGCARALDVMCKPQRGIKADAAEKSQALKPVKIRYGAFPNSRQLFGGLQRQVLLF